jgi:hypothetical protein
MSNFDRKHPLLEKVLWITHDTVHSTVGTVSLHEFEEQYHCWPTVCCHYVILDGVLVNPRLVRTYTQIGANVVYTFTNGETLTCRSGLDKMRNARGFVGVETR